MLLVNILFKGSVLGSLNNNPYQRLICDGFKTQIIWDTFLSFPFSACLKQSGITE